MVYFETLRNDDFKYVLFCTLPMVEARSTGTSFSVLTISGKFQHGFTVGAEDRQDGGFKIIKRKVQRWITQSYGSFRSLNWLK